MLPTIIKKMKLYQTHSNLVTKYEFKNTMYLYIIKQKNAIVVNCVFLILLLLAFLDLSITIKSF